MTPEQREADRIEILNGIPRVGYVGTLHRLICALGMDAETAMQEIVDEINRQQGRAA